MMLKLKLKGGVIHEIPVEEILEIDGLPYKTAVKVDADNHEDRIRLLERGLANVMEFLDETHKLVPSPQNERMAVVDNPFSGPEMEMLSR